MQYWTPGLSIEYNVSERQRIGEFHMNVETCLGVLQSILKVNGLT